MTTAYTSLLGLALPVTGELSGTWGDTVNNGITSLVDSSVAGTTNISTDTDVTLTTTTGAANTARQTILLFSGARTALRTVTAPAQSKTYTVINATTGGFAVKLIGSGPTTGVTIIAGESAFCAWNGSDFVKVSNTGGAYTVTDLTVTGNTILGDANTDTATVNALGRFNALATFGYAGTTGSTLTTTAPAFVYSGATTYTDTSVSGGTKTHGPFWSLAIPTLANPTTATTYTNASTLYIAGAPAAGTNITITNPFALYVAAGASYFGGSVNFAGSATLSGTTLSGNLLFSPDNTYDIGASGATRARNLYLAGLLTMGGALTVDSTTDSSSTTTGSIQTDGGVGVAKSVFVGGTVNTVGLTVNLATTASAVQIKGSSAGSSNLILQDNAGSGVAWWLSAKTSGILAIGGNGGSEPALGSINVGSTGNVSVGANAGSGLFQVGTPGSATGSLRAFSAYVSVDAAYQSANVYGTAAAPALIFGGDDNTGIWHPASDVIAFSNNGGETARFDASKNLIIGTTVANGKLTTYSGVAGGTATTLTPAATFWLEYAAAIGDNRGSGVALVLQSSNTVDGTGKSAQIGAPSEDSGGLHRIVGLSFWTSSFDANRAEVGRFTGNYGNFLVGNTTAYSTETATVQAKGGFIWAANNTGNAGNRNWRAVANATVNGALEFWDSSTNTGYPNDVVVMSMLESAVTFPRSDVVISNATGLTTNFFRAYEVGAGGNNAGFSCGAAGAKGSVYGASGVSGLRIVGGNPGLIQFGYSTSDTSVSANFASLGTWSTTGLGVGTDNPQFKLDVNRGSSGVVLNLDGTNAYGAETGVSFSAQRAKISGFLESAGGTPGASLRFYTQPNSGGLFERVRITSDGNTEIGTPAGLGRQLNVNSATDGYTMGLLQTGAATSGANSGVVFQGYYDGSSITDMASIRGGKENTTSGNFGGKLTFFTRVNGGSDTERVRITSTGQTLFGLTGSAAPASAAVGIYASFNSASLGVIGARNGSGRNTFSVIGDSNFDCGYVGTSSATGTDALLEVNGGNGVRFTVSASERGRFIGNNFMVGTTSTDGTIGNDIGSITGRTKTAAGSITAGAAGWYAAFTIANPGLYILHAYIGGYNAGPSDWSNGWFITYTGGNNAFISSSVFGATGNIQARITTPATVDLFLQAGSGIVYTWVVQRIG